MHKKLPDLFNAPNTVKVFPSTADKIDKYRFMQSEDCLCSRRERDWLFQTYN